MNKKDFHQVIIIGSGSAGWSAAVYAARANLKPLLFTGEETGGQLMITNDVENYTGFEFVTGPELMDKMQKHAEKFETQVIYKKITKIETSMHDNKQFFILHDSSGEIYHTWSIIIATGAKAKWLDIESERHYKGYGVSGCATCDGFFYKNKIVAVVGGGNTAMEEALFLTNFAKKVYVIHRGNNFPKAEKILINRLMEKTKGENPQVEILFERSVYEVIGEEILNSSSRKVTGVLLKNLKNEVEKEPLIIDGLFIAIGHEPNSELFADLVKLKDNRYIETIGKTTHTSHIGIFAAGDIQDDRYRQAITAAGSGCMAALDVCEYLDSLGF